MTNTYHHSNENIYIYIYIYRNKHNNIHMKMVDTAWRFKVVTNMTDNCLTRKKPEKHSQIYPSQPKHAPSTTNEYHHSIRQYRKQKHYMHQILLVKSKIIHKSTH